jgi:hypothetical protein
MGNAAMPSGFNSCLVTSKDVAGFTKLTEGGRAGADSPAGKSAGFTGVTAGTTFIVNGTKGVCFLGTLPIALSVPEAN